MTNPTQNANSPAYPSREKLIVKLKEGDYARGQVNDLQGLTKREYAFITICAQLAPTWLPLLEGEYKFPVEPVIRAADELTEAIFKHLDHEAK